MPIAPSLVLDAPTLLFVTALVLAFSGALTILSAGQRREATPLSAPLLAWGIAMLLGAGGLLLTAIAQRHPWLSNGGGTAMFLAGSALSWTGARIFVRLPTRPLLAAAGPVLWLAATPLQDGGPAWTALACWIGAGCTIATAAALRHGRAERLASRNPALALLIIHAALYSGRGAMALLGGPSPAWADA